jgi:hypothetical protein
VINAKKSVEVFLQFGNILSGMVADQLNMEVMRNIIVVNMEKI